MKFFCHARFRKVLVEGAPTNRFIRAAPLGAFLILLLAFAPRNALAMNCEYMGLVNFQPLWLCESSYPVNGGSWTTSGMRLSVIQPAFGWGRYARCGNLSNPFLPRWVKYSVVIPPGVSVVDSAEGFSCTDV
jgi:hypothetical protein